jgi:hypothetical protein
LYPAKKSDCSKQAPRHHIATNKREQAAQGPRTFDYEELFSGTGIDIDGPANAVCLAEHKGPHPVEYHDIVYGALANARGSAQRPDAKSADRMKASLAELAASLLHPGSCLNRLVTTNVKTCSGR